MKMGKLCQGDTTLNEGVVPPTLGRRKIKTKKN